MNRVYFLIVAALLLLAASVPALDARGGLIQAVTQASDASPAKELSFPKGTEVLAKWITDVDLTKTKKDDLVEAQTVENIKSGNEVLRSGSILKGRVVVIQLFSARQPKSILGLLFDKVILKSGEERSLNSTISALAPPGESAPEQVVNPSIHSKEPIRGTIPYLDDKSRGVHDIDGVSLGYETIGQSHISVVSSIAGNVHLKKSMQVVFDLGD
jgi:hypothetical protein